MPAPFTSSQYDPDKRHAYDPLCDCNYCYAEFHARIRSRAGNPHAYGAPEKPGLNWSLAHYFRLLGLSLAIVLIFLAAGYAGRAMAREGAVKPVRAPQSLLKARQACPNTSSLAQCRGELRKAYASVEWQRKARNKAHAYTSRDVVVDAINWASAKTGVPAWRLTAIANCESHLFWLAHNGQYLGVWQLGATHRADPIFRVVPWQDPYAQAIHTARFIKRHGESAWQCSSGGGLRW
jgi:hypothetical protein